MDKIQHKYVDTRGLKFHLAEIGTGDQVVVFLHGFPEIWYSWRCYGLSEIPQEPEKSTFLDLVHDLSAIFDSLAISNIRFLIIIFFSFCFGYLEQAYVIGKHFGALTAYQFTILYPEREPVGRAEADFGHLEVKNVVRNIYILFSKSEITIAEEDKEIMDLVDESHEDLSAYATHYEKSGFRTALQVPYRSLAENFPVSNPIVKTPALFIVGGKDYSLKLPGMEGYITGGGMKEVVPDLEVNILPEGSHFVQEQNPDEVNELIATFLKKIRMIWIPDSV
ncbi:hypothetical protein MKW92_020669 [Papaver armeniacum]|nr:hypothetical protein MKW92_020669 [Papaver armeniacum]